MLETGTCNLMKEKMSKLTYPALHYYLTMILIMNGKNSLNTGIQNNLIKGITFKKPSANIHIDSFVFYN